MRDRFDPKTLIQKPFEAEKIEGILIHRLTQNENVFDLHSRAARREATQLVQRGEFVDWSEHDARDEFLKMNFVWHGNRLLISIDNDGDLLEGYTTNRQIDNSLE